MKKIFFILIILFFISCNNNNENDNATVKYIVNGSSTADIQYTFGDSLKTLNSQSLPWEYTYKLWTDESDTYIAFLSATNLSTSAITLEILVEGEIENQISFSGLNETQSIQVKINLEHEDSR